MIVGLGIDLVEIERFKAVLRRQGDRFVERVFTIKERGYCEGKLNRPAHYAARFAAKEAVLKALGTGWSGGIAWTDVCITPVKAGPAEVKLSGVAARVAEEKGIKRMLVSLSHTAESVTAVAVAEG
ncbi:MAG: holo-ACP synthase [Planctomycetota bacterium]|jgi:holo-[acyl-carrier protein] synthase